MVKSILRYVGGKSRAVKYILPYLQDADCLYSPFFGGGSIEFAFASIKDENKVYGCDLYKPVAVFWNQVMLNPKPVAPIVESYLSLDKKTYYELQKKLPNIENPVEMAAIFYVLNRASFSGSTNSGGMSYKTGRFNENSIKRLKDFKCSNVEVLWKDAFEFLKELVKINPKGKVIYLDPPYMINNNLYGDKGDMHRNFNHQKLFEMIKILDSLGWKIVLSYNKTDNIEQWYSDFNIIPLDWKYGANATKKSDEILITNRCNNEL